MKQRTHAEDEEVILMLAIGQRTPDFRNLPVCVGYERILRYKGRIDDSRDPAKATYSDLEHALEDVLAQRMVRVAETKPFGCAIVR